MNCIRYINLGAACAALLFALGGCGGANSGPPSGKPDAKKTSASHAEHDHSGHDHAGHDHDHGGKGPHGGQIIELGEEEYHAEWLHDDKADKVTFYILDSAMKKVPIEAEQITVDITLAGQTTNYKVPAVKRSAGDKPVSSVFETVDKSLLVGLTLGEGATAMLHVGIRGKTYDAKIENGPHDEHDHEKKTK